MAPTPSISASASAAPKLPASADFNALYNRISLASAKQTTFLNAMRAKYPSLSRSSTSSTTAPALTTANGSTFSALTKPTASSSSNSTSKPNFITQTSSRPTPEDSDLRFENPNTGLGYTASKSETETSAATRDLSRRLLGKRGRGREDNAAAAAASQRKRRAAQEVESEEEEEEGRSGLGRTKKKNTKRARTEEDEALDAADDGAMADVDVLEGSDSRADGSDTLPKALPSNGDQSSTEVVQDDGAVAQDLQASEARPEIGEGKKKKRKQKKNKKRKKVAADSVGLA